MPNWYFFHSDGMFSNIVFERPKSSFTEASPLLLGVAEDSEEDLPRYSHFEIRAKPCCGRPLVA